MNLPRWWNKAFESKLVEYDAQFARERRSGALVIEVHYHEGVGRMSKFRDWILPPAMFEVRFSATSS